MFRITEKLLEEILVDIVVDKIINLIIRWRQQITSDSLVNNTEHVLH